MIAVDLLLLQMELEAIKPVSGELIARACEDVHDFPLVFSARTFDGQSLVWFDELIPAELRGRLSREELLAFETETAIDVLREADIYAEASQFSTYTFPENVGAAMFCLAQRFSRDDPRIVAFGFGELADEVFAVECEGEILSACASARQNAKAAEAWVVTHLNHRGKGMARQVVTAWAASLLKQGLTPFYSHHIINENSARLASHLGRVPVFDVTVIEQCFPCPGVYA